MVWTQGADGMGAAERIVHGDRWVEDVTWSPDGRWLVLWTEFVIGPSDIVAGLSDILAMRPGVDSVATPLIASERFFEAGPAISRDGRWLAYSSNETGRLEIFVRPFPNVDDGKWQVSAEGGVQPVWAHNGRELFFVNATPELLSVQFTARGDTFRRGRVTPLFTVPNNIYTRQGPSRFYDVAPDDERFLMARPPSAENTPISAILVQNFFEELKRLVPD